MKTRFTLAWPFRTRKVTIKETNVCSYHTESLFAVRWPAEMSHSPRRHPLFNRLSPRTMLTTELDLRRERTEPRTLACRRSNVK